MGEKTQTAIQKFDADHGKVARVIIVALAGPPVAILTVLGLAAGCVLAIPAVALGLLAAVPHWLRNGR